MSNMIRNVNYINYGRDIHLSSVRIPDLGNVQIHLPGEASDQILYGVCLKYDNSQDPNIFNRFSPMVGVQTYIQQYKKSHNDTHAFYKELIKSKPNTRAIASNLGSRPYLILTDLDLVKLFSQENVRNYKKLKLWKFVDLGFGSAVFFAEGAHWKAQRKLLGAAFNYDTLKSFVPSIKATTQLYMQEFRDQITKNGKYELHCLKNTEELIADILLKTYFSLDMRKEQVNGKSIAWALIEIVDDMFQASKTATHFILCDLFGVRAANAAISSKEKVLKKKLDRIAIYAKQSISDRLSGKVKENDFLQYYVSEMRNSQQEKLKDPSVIEITEHEIFSQFMTFFFAGMDTTGHLIGLALYEITKNPQIQKRIKEEFALHIPNEEAFTLDNLKKCVYFTAVLNETLRFYPPAAITFLREASQDHKLKDIHIKKGTAVAVSIMTICHHPLFYKEPHIYNPDRWLTDIIEPYAFAPFSFGQRNCIGQHLSMLEARIILYSYLTQFKLEINEKTKLVLESTLLYGPADDNLIILK